MAKEHETASRGQATVNDTARREVCDRCGGTGLICGHVPVIDSKNCCADYANAICPDCRGSGVPHHRSSL